MRFRCCCVLMVMILALNVMASFPKAQGEASGDVPGRALSGEVTLSFVGDCSIGDEIKQRRYSKSLTTKVETYGYAWLFETVSAIFHQDDLTLANLEVVLSDYTVPHNANKSFHLIAPPEFREILPIAGIDAVNTVNNHSIDFNYQGYRDTLLNLDEAGVKHFGTLNPARDTNRFVDHLILDIQGIRFGFMGYTYPTNNDLKTIRQEIEELRNQECEVVVVSFHWGRETYKTPQATQFNYAVEVLEAGADVIWGHHPHVLQPVYFYQGKPILFSTGNFVFGTIANLDPATGIFQLRWQRDETGSVVLKSMTMIPCRTQKGGEFQPLLLTEEKDAEECLKHVMGKARKGFTELPAGFEKSGTVYLQADGSLLTERP